MNMMIYNDIRDSCRNRKLLAVLVDPDRYTDDSMTRLVQAALAAGIDYFLVGGSLVSRPVDQTVEFLKQSSDIPVILFPGSLLQISRKADALLLLSLISGRNPELLIGNHVIAAPVLKNSGLEIISTGYMLIEDGRSSSVEYISNTKPIPEGKPDIAIATALAGEMIGHSLIYLEAGSGASRHVPAALIRAVKDNIKIPLVVGGGIATGEDLQRVYSAGAEMAVIGNILEKGVDRLAEISRVRDK